MANTEILEKILGNDLCAKWINLRDYALDTLSANPSIKAIMDVSDKYHLGEWALVNQVPKMTSNTAPYGEAFGSTVFSSNYAYYKAFLGQADDYGWLPTASDSSPYIGYKFINPVNIKRVSITVRSQNYPSSTETIYLQGSNDGTTWADIDSLTLTNISTSTSTLLTDSFDVDNNLSYLYYRIKQNSIMVKSGSSYWSPVSIQFLTYQPKGNVPIMTSNTAPYGEAFGSTVFSSNYAYYKAFLGQADDYGWLPTASDSSPYIGYKFINPVNIKRVSITVRSQNYPSSTETIYLQGSNDGTTWADIDSLTLTNISTSTSTLLTDSFDVDNNLSYLYYRIKQNSIMVKSGSSYWSPVSIQFYGREMTVSVPTMTSNTAPYGEAIKSEEYNSNYPAWKAFNGIIATTYADGAGWMPTNTAGNHYIGYHFIRPASIKRLRIGFSGTANVSVVCNLLASNDGFINDIHIIKSNIFNNEAVAANKWIDIDLENDDDYAYYKIDGDGTQMFVPGFGWKLNFFGFDYSERDWDTEHPMHYIYDHGVELEEMSEVDNGGTTTEIIKNSNDFEILSTSANYGIGAIFRNISLSTYSLFRAKLGNKVVYGNVSYLVVCPLNYAIGVIADAAYVISQTNSPDNHSLDVSAFDVNKDIGVLLAGNVADYTIKELWLE